MELKAKTVVITGAARGIGRAMAEEFAAAGANVGLIDVNKADLADTRAACEALGVKAEAFGASVTDEARVVAAFDQVVAQFGRFDGLINNAGILRDAVLIKEKDGVITSKMSLEQWRAVIDVNLTGVFICGREAAERMIQLGNGGVIINISSISRAGNAGQTNYAAAKAGVAAMAVVWAKELARYGIRVGSIAPGATRTSILDSMRPEMLDKLVAPVPLQRLAKPAEIAHAARFIFENDYYTGRVLELDGGLRV